jgi:hypothetical protein
MTKHDRVFLVGDAVHNHSPLVGLGMNVSMQYVPLYLMPKRFAASILMLYQETPTIWDGNSPECFKRN